jgi:hypothetical protein
MKLEDIVKELHLKVHTGGNLLGREVSGGYAGDLLSDVLAHARKDSVWVTLHTHANIVAVATTKEISGIIIVQARVPDAQTTKSAVENMVPILISSFPAFETVSRLNKLGVA